MIGLMRPGTRVEIELIRDGRRRTVSAVLGTLSAETASAPAPALQAEPVFDGVELAPGKADNGVDGLSVVSVAPGSLAAERGLRTGDVITFINRQRVRSVSEARQIMADARTVILQVQRDGRALLILMR
jgi:S1-C subfamily serine protease